MITASVISRLTDLKYQGKIKKYNITITSKNNEFGDVVKFFAQINKNDVIQKISFKATGCTAFIAVCSYFCEMIDGKSVASALKITQDKINALVNLDERREHVFPIILNTFALLIKKYRKGVETKTIVPCEVEMEESAINKKPSTKSIEKKKTPENVAISEKKVANNILSTNNDETRKQENIKKDPQLSKSIDTNSKSKTKSKIEITKEKIDKGKKVYSEIKKENNNKEYKTEVDTIEVEIIPDNSQKDKKESVSDIPNSIVHEEIQKAQNEHLNNLQNLVDNHDNVVVESNINHSHDLSYLLQKVKDGNTHKMEHKTTITTTTTKTVSVTSNVDSAKSSLEELQKVNDEKNVARETIEIMSSEPKKKRSFFDVFKKKK